jgi:hypothetical protein
VSLQNTLKGMYVPGIPAKDLTLDNLRKGLQQQPQKWAPVASQLIRAAPEACQSVLCADEALVTGLAAYLCTACSGAAANEDPYGTWVEGAGALSQLLTLDCPLKLEAHTILPIFQHCLQHRHDIIAATALTSYLVRHLTTTVFQHPTLLLNIFNQLDAPAEGFDDARRCAVSVLNVMMTEAPAEVAAHGTFLPKLHQLLVSGHDRAGYLLSCVSMTDSGRQLIASQPELLAALAASLHGPNAAWPKMLWGLRALVCLATSPDSSLTVLADPTCCQALVVGMATALGNLSVAAPRDAYDVWGWLEKLVCHEPSRQVLLTWPQQQAPQQQGQQLGVEQGGAAAAAAGSGTGSRFLSALATALQRLPPGAEGEAGIVFSTLLEAAPDQQQLLEELEVGRWLSSVCLARVAGAAQLPWAQAVALLLSQPAGRAALWAAPGLLQWVFGHAWMGDGADLEDEIHIQCHTLRDQMRQDAGYQAALLQGLRADNSHWVRLLRLEASEALEGIQGPGGRTVCATYSVLQLPGFVEALAEGCMQQRPRQQQEGSSHMWRLVRLLLYCPPLGHALFDEHPALVTAAASLFERAEGEFLEDLLLEFSCNNMCELKGYVMKHPELLRGVVMAFVGTPRSSSYTGRAKYLATQPWFRQVVDGDEGVLDALLRALGPAAQSQQQQGEGESQTSASCQEAVLGQFNKEALFPSLLQRLSSTGDVKLVQGAWNGLDWLRRSGAPWDEAVPRALGNMVTAAGRAGELPQLQLAVTQTAVQLAQEHAALREQQQLLEAARAELAAAGGGANDSCAAAGPEDAPPQQQQQQQDKEEDEPEGEQVQEGGRKRRPQRTGSGRDGGKAAAAAQLSSKRARRR